MAEDRNLKPLRNVILCSTGLTPDQRTELNSKATAMGAIVNMDFTTTTTHLVAEKLNSLKYKFVAKNRLDVKVMGLHWINSLHALWVAGEDFDLRELEDKYKLPTFCGLNICVTSILEDERLKMIKLLENNGAAYHPDLTRRVTHLVSPDTQGKKYHFAKKWKITVVGPEWVYDSLDRGMVLEERFYDPRLPVESRGEGAKPEPPAAPVAPVNVVDNSSSATVVGDVQPPVAPEGSLTKRRLRASAEGKFGSQSNDLWSSIMGQASNPKPKKVSEWEESAGDVHYPVAPMADEVDDAPAPAKAKTGIFANMNFFLLGFSEKEALKLRDAIGSFDGSVIESLNAFHHPFHLPEKSILLVPPQTPLSQTPRSPPGVHVLVLRYWWLEMCMFMQRFVEPDEFGRGVLYRPAERHNVIDDFKGMKISSTGFGGIELLHITKIVDLLGAEYSQELKHHDTNLLIRNPSSATTQSGGKIDAAEAWNIPVVDLPWLWDSIEQHQRLPLDKYTYKNPTLKRKRSEVRTPADKRRRPSPPPLPFEEEEEEEVRRVDDAAPWSSGPSKPRSRAAEANNARKSGKKRSEPVTTRGDRKFLMGKRICISRALKEVADDLGDLAESLGAEVVDSFDADDDEPITHLIHRSKKPNDQTRDYRIAKTIPGVSIVSADWLRKSSKAGKALDEFAYPPFEDGRPMLVLAKSAPDTPPKKQARVAQRAVGGLKLDRLPQEEESTDDELRPLPNLSFTASHIAPTAPMYREQEPLLAREITPQPPPLYNDSPSRPFADEIPRCTSTSRSRSRSRSPSRPVKKEYPADNPVSHLLKLKPEALSSLLAQPPRPRRKGLTGRALSTLSANTTSSSNRTPPESQLKKNDSQDGDMSMELDKDQFPESTQSRVYYADKAESILERKRIMEKVGATMEEPVVRKVVNTEMRDVVTKKARRGPR